MGCRKECSHTFFTVPATSSTSVCKLMPTSSAGPGVRFPPPILFVIGFLFAWLIDRHWRALPIVHPGSPALEWGGVVLIVAGVALAAWGVLTFRAADTTIIPNQPASRLVAAGPYRFTRNPMYTGFTLAYLGACALMNSWWPVVLLPLVLFLLTSLVIRREEAHLAESFGSDYASYRERVRRWL
jgi:protein-S-isoprenylcysteine O-methyltransferase Ste14